MSLRAWLFGTTAWLLLAAGPVAAQTSVNASLGIRATDASGAVLPGVVATLENSDTGLSETQHTDQHGQAMFPRVRPGGYRLRADLAGFATAVHEGIVVSVNAALAIDVVLQVAGVSDTVTVSSRSIEVDRRSSSVSLVIGGTRIRDLPLNSKDFQRLMYLAPGVAGPRAGNNNPSVSGTRVTSNNYVVDGLSANEEQQVGGLAPGNTGLTMPNVISTEALQEFRVVTSNADATFGRGAGGQINAITKSGTNRISGSAYEYVRDEAFDARDFFNTAPSLPPFHQDLFGGTFGGPIARDRHFVFASYEGFRQRLEQTASPTLPNAALINLVPGDLGRLMRAFYFRNGLVPTTGIPSGRFSPFSATDRATAVAAGFPAHLFDESAANDEAGVVVAGGTTTQDIRQDSWLVRTDHRLHDRLTVSARYAGAGSEFDSSLIPSAARVTRQERTFHSVLGQAVATLSPAHVLEVRGGLLRTTAPQYPVDIDPAVLGLGFDPQRGLNMILGGTTTFQMPFVSSTPIFANQQSTPQLAAMHTWTRGSLTLRSGFDVRWLNVEFGNMSFAGQTYQFNGLVGPTGILGSSPGQAQAIAQEGRTTLFGQEGAPPTALRQYRSTQHEYFSQADWRVRHDLTLNLGLRYSIFGVYDFEGAANLYAVDSEQLVPDASPLAFGRSSNRMAPVGEDVPLYQPDYDNLQPRVGIAWDVGGRGRTIARAAYGIYHDRLFQFGFANVVTNAPFAISTASPNTPFMLGSEIPVNPAAPSIFTIDPSIRNPYVHRFSAGAEQQVFGATSVAASYVGTRGRDLARIVDLNFAGGFPLNQRPDQRFSNMRLLTNISESDYDSLQMLVRSRLGRAVDVTAAYTFSRYRDFLLPDTIGATTPVPATLVNLGASAAAGYQIGPFAERTSFDEAYGVSELNVPHNLQVHHLVDVPLGRGRRWLADASTLVNAIVGGWTVAGIFQARSGAAVDIQWGSDINDDGNTTDRPRLLAGALEDLYSSGGDQRQHLLPQFDARQLLGLPADAVYLTDSIPRNALRGPSVFTYDVSVIRRVPLVGRAQLTLEANVFNLFNRANLGTPSGNLASSLFGIITSTLAGYGPRQMQFGAKLTF